MVKHTSTKSFNSFIPSRGRLGIGIYFADSNYKLYDSVGQVTYSAFLNMKKPKRYDGGELGKLMWERVTDKYNNNESKQTQAIDDIILEDRAAGIDGYISKTQGEEYMIFEPNQIKSLFNRGTFDESTDNIYFELIGAEVTENVDVLPKLREFVNSQGFKLLPH